MCYCLTAVIRVEGLTAGKVIIMWYWYEQVILSILIFSFIQFIQFYVLKDDIVIFLIKKMQGKK